MKIGGGNMHEMRFCVQKKGPRIYAGLFQLLN